MKKPIFFYGLGDKASNYKALSKYLNIVPIDWNKPEKTKAPKSDIVVGFSMGCYLALDYAWKRKVKKLILCSIPPTENLGKLKARDIILIFGSKEKYSIKLAPKGKYKMLIVKGGDHAIKGSYRKQLINILK